MSASPISDFAEAASPAASYQYLNPRAHRAFGGRASSAPKPVARWASLRTPHGPSRDGRRFGRRAIGGRDAVPPNAGGGARGAAPTNSSGSRRSSTISIAARRSARSRRGSDSARRAWARPSTTFSPVACRRTRTSRQSNPGIPSLVTRGHGRPRSRAVATEIISGLSGPKTCRKALKRWNPGAGSLGVADIFGRCRCGARSGVRARAPRTRRGRVRARRGGAPSPGNTTQPVKTLNSRTGAGRPAQDPRRRPPGRVVLWRCLRRIRRYCPRRPGRRPSWIGRGRTRWRRISA